MNAAVVLSTGTVRQGYPAGDNGAAGVLGSITYRIPIRCVIGLDGDHAAVAGRPFHRVIPPEETASKHIQLDLPCCSGRSVHRSRGQADLVGHRYYMDRQPVGILAALDGDISGALPQRENNGSGSVHPENVRGLIDQGELTAVKLIALQIRDRQGRNAKWECDDPAAAEHNTGGIVPRNGHLA